MKTMRVHITYATRERGAQDVTIVADFDQTIWDAVMLTDDDGEPLQTVRTEEAILAFNAEAERLVAETLPPNTPFEVAGIDDEADSRIVYITTICSAVVKETWTMRVPRDVEVTNDNALDVLADLAGEGFVLDIESEILNEEDRTLSDIREER